MDDVIALCNNAKTFPLNLQQQNLSTYNQSLYEQLNTHAERLFAEEDEASLCFLDLHSRGKGKSLQKVEYLRDVDLKYRLLAVLYKL